MKDRLYTAAEVQSIVDDTLMSALHPEFGTAWREGDGEFWLATESLRQKIAEQEEETEALNERITFLLAQAQDNARIKADQAETIARVRALHRRGQIVFRGRLVHDPQDICMGCSVFDDDEPEIVLSSRAWPCPTIAALATSHAPRVVLATTDDGK